LQEAVKSKQQQCIPVTKINDNPHFVEIASLANKKVRFVYKINRTFLSDAFLEEHDAHFVRDDVRAERIAYTHLNTKKSAFPGESAFFIS